MNFLGLSVWQWDVLSLVVVVTVFTGFLVRFTKQSITKYPLYVDLKDFSKRNRK